MLQSTDCDLRWMLWRLGTAFGISGPPGMDTRCLDQARVTGSKKDWRPRQWVGCWSIQNDHGLCQSDDSSMSALLLSSAQFILRTALPTSAPAFLASLTAKTGEADEMMLSYPTNLRVFLFPAIHNTPASARDEHHPPTGRVVARTCLRENIDSDGPKSPHREKWQDESAQSPRPSDIEMHDGSTRGRLRGEPRCTSGETKPLSCSRGLTTGQQGFRDVFLHLGRPGMPVPGCACRESWVRRCRWSTFDVEMAGCAPPQGPLRPHYEAPSRLNPTRGCSWRLTVCGLSASDGPT